jgi:prepilin-type N-terminal cleavage/methylation domain-containing protein
MPISISSRSSAFPFKYGILLFRNGFTLVELMVATVVLTLIMLLMAQVLNQMEHGVNILDRKLDSSSLIRVALNKIGYDLSSRVIVDTTIGITAIKHAGNDELDFYSYVRTTAAESRFAKLDFVIGTQQSATSTQTIPALLVGNTGVGWNIDPLTITNAGPEDCLSAGIFRFEVAFLSTTGVLTANPPPVTTQLRAVIVAVAALDPQTYQQLTPTQISSLPGRLSDAVDGQPPATAWTNVDYSDLPMSVQQNVRISERYFYVR